jgi:amidase/aspartyl-tRNA(Asn)/glutamyl-tRNA(Gln) amidotransferase subunit A
MIQGREAELGRPVREDEIEPQNWSKLADAKKIDGVALAAARDTFQRVGEQMSELMTRSDVLLSLTMAEPPMKLGVMSLSSPSEEEFMSAATAAFTMLFNVSGQPAMSVPLHWTPEGLPVGVQFAAALGGEDVLFRLGAQPEEAQPWFGKRPSL